jgi:hypothetical protein
MAKLSIAGTTALEDNSQYTNRFEISSESSSRVYVVAQNKGTGEWSCSCPGWIIKRPGKERNCKHLKALMPILIESETNVPKKIESKPKPKAKPKAEAKPKAKKSRKIQS